MDEDASDRDRAAGVVLADDVALRGHVTQATMATRGRRRDDPAEEQRERSVDQPEDPPDQGVSHPDDRAVGPDDAYAGRGLAEREAGQPGEHAEVEERERDLGEQQTAGPRLVDRVTDGDDL